MRSRTFTAIASILICLTNVVSIADESSAPGIVTGPHYREVLFYLHQERFFPAIVRLLAAEERARLDIPRPDELTLLLGEMRLSYGQREQAARAFERLLAGPSEPAVREQARMLLAKIRHQQGLPDDAKQLLLAIDGDLPDVVKSERQALLATLYIENGEYDSAIDVLSAWSGPDPRIDYARYNLGVAMARSGRIGPAADLLGELGGLDQDDEETRSLRDKANLALGYAFLQDGQPDAARLRLKEVRFSGPFSSQALLGLGWADSEVDGYRRALVPWSELQKRPLTDPAVRHSMLAIPYAMTRLESLGQAADQYVTAINAFETESRKIDFAIETIRRGGMTSALVTHGPVPSNGANPGSDESLDWRYLYPLLATNEFQARLDDLRELEFLSANLDDRRHDVNVFRDMLTRRQLAYDRRLPVVQNILSEQRIERLLRQKLDFDARLDSIEKHEDSLALATNHEFGVWHEASDIESNPALSNPLEEADAVLDKVGLLKGVLRWTLDKEFDERLSRARLSVSETGTALAETQRLRGLIEEAMHRERLLIADIEVRVEKLSPTIDDLKIRIQYTMRRQRDLLERIAVDELQAQRDELDSYEVQARFALAAIYDISARESLQSPGGARR